MPSWSAHNPPEAPAAPPATGATGAVERARRLLEQLLAGKPRDEQIGKERSSEADQRSSNRS